MEPRGPLWYRLLTVPFVLDALVVVCAAEPDLDQAISAGLTHAQLVSASAHHAPRIAPVDGSCAEEGHDVHGHGPANKQWGGRGERSKEQRR